MVLTIARLGQAGRNRGIVPLALYSVGLLSGAAFVGLSLGWVGNILRSGMARLFDSPAYIPNIALAALALTLGLTQLRLLSIRLPARQVTVDSRWWFLLGPSLASLGWGFIIGLGVLTEIRYVGYYLILAVILLLGDASYGVYLMALYALGRVSSTWLAAVAVRRGKSPVAIALIVAQNRERLVVANAFALIVVATHFAVNQGGF